MSDLISRSKLIDYFYYGIDDKPIIDGITDRKIINIIKNQPTAYDIDKVVEELQSEAEIREDSGNEYGDECEFAVARGLRNAIEIVKQVCVSDDVCEWKILGEHLVSPHKSLVFCVTYEAYRYHYCPVCGKKIKEKNK